MKYYCIKQHDITDCGAACLATICKQNGYRIGITKIREVAGTDKQGTNAYGVIKAAEQLGFSAKGVKGNKEAFFSEFPLPCIAHVIVDGQLLHYVVIHKITKKQVIIADPGVGIVKLKPEEFFGEVHEEGKPPKYQWSGVLILLVKNETFMKGDETKGLFSRFFHLLLPQKKLLLHIFVASLVYTILGIVGAFYFIELIDSVLPDGLQKTLMTLSIGVILPIIGNHEYALAQVLDFVTQEITEDSISKIDEKTLQNIIEYQNIGGQVTLDDFQCFYAESEL